jgi:hypothetical protein
MRVEAEPVGWASSASRPYPCMGIFGCPEPYLLKAKSILIILWQRENGDNQQAQSAMISRKIQGCPLSTFVA